MINKSLVKVPMPQQEPGVRKNNFDEVALGYTPKMAQEEADRCLQCKHKPCASGCPVNVDVPGFIQLISQGEFDLAYDKILQSNALPAICGRVCPQERQCEAKCVRAIKGEAVAIGRLERFAADAGIEKCDLSEKPLPSTGKKVAVVGSGPAGLSCAGSLAKKGYEVTIFEALHLPGGVLMYGIPEFRLPKALVQREIQTIEALGVQISTNQVVGRTITIDELLNEEGYQAVFVGSGAGLPKFQNIPGEDLPGVYAANEFLTRINLMKAYDRENSDTPIIVGKNVAVIGGGNVTMDAARSALRLGAETVTVVYRRGEEEMPARLEEIHHAKEEGIQFALLTLPVEILGEETVTGMICQKMELSDPDASGRRSPQPLEGSEFTMAVDTVIVAIGNNPNPLIKKTTPGIETTSWGGIVTKDAYGKTSREEIWAGGDIVTGAATVILAMGAGKKAAQGIDEYLNEI